jgi:hypothetical protein
MVRTVMAVVTVALLMVLHVVGLRHVGGFRASEPSRTIDYVLPGPILRITAVQFDGLAADLMLLKATTFFGERTYKRMRLAPQEWDRLTETLEAATVLDPVFLDPYHFGEMVLTWDAGRVADANRLLEKALSHRRSDWVIPFYLGFNHFYFLHDDEKGAEYLMIASRLPDSHKFVGLLAARLSTRAGRTEAAIIFLDELGGSISDPRLKQQVAQRADALKAIALIERGIAVYQEQYGKAPERVEQLVERRVLKGLPPDPYGGRFFLDEHGRVQTTSRLVARPVTKQPGHADSR